MRSRSVERFRRRPAETQRKELERLLRECARTEFGRRYGFGEIRTPEAFAQRVERFDYTSFKPYVERMMAGEAAGTGEPGTGKEETAVPVEKAQEGKAADTRRRKGRQADYETTFLKGMDIPARYGKPVYVRREYHERIAKISVMLTGGKVSLSAYIDNVLAQHFEQYREEIEAAYAGKLENLF